MIIAILIMESLIYQNARIKHSLYELFCNFFVLLISKYFYIVIFSKFIVNL